jgi:hypothetical protein
MELEATVEDMMDDSRAPDAGRSDAGCIQQCVWHGDQRLAKGQLLDEAGCASERGDSGCLSRGAAARLFLFYEVHDFRPYLPDPRRAANFYFGKPPDALRVDELATIVAVGGAPRRNSSTLPPEYLEAAKKQLLSVYGIGQ